MTPLTEKQIILGFRRATRGFTQNCWTEWTEMARIGMTDEVLEIRLKLCIGIMGASSGCDEYPEYSYQASGLKIWLGNDQWGRISERGNDVKPTFQGKQTIAMARRVYGIKNPNQLQAELF